MRNYLLPNIEQARETLRDAVQQVMASANCGDREDAAQCADAMHSCVKAFGAFSELIIASLENTPWGGRSSPEDFSGYLTNNAGEFIPTGNDIREHEDDSAPYDNGRFGSLPRNQFGFTTHTYR